MKVTTIIDEDFSNYKVPSMLIGTTKCNKRCPGCQNWELRKADIFEIDNSDIIKRFMRNPITSAIVIGGLEPFDSFEDILFFYRDFREESNCPVIIYTGYKEEEIIYQILQLGKSGGGLIVKFGHYIEGQEKHYDDILGVELASDNQYAKKFEFNIE